MPQTLRNGFIADDTIPKDVLPCLTWPNFFYRQQVEFTQSRAWQVWFIAGNGCFGKGTKMMRWTGRSVAVEDVKVGDLLMGDDSTPREVLNTVKGSEPLYEFEIKMRHGSKKYVFNENHILYLESTDYESPVEVTVKEFVTWPERKQRGYYFCRREVEFPQVNATKHFPPYILGLWLGDGNTNGRRYSSADDALVKEFESYIESIGCSLRYSGDYHYEIIGVGNGNKPNAFTSFLDHYALRAYKHIPVEYLYATKDERLELLAGLIDTDGSYAPGKISFWQTDKHLSEQVCFLAKSLGINATLKSVKDGTQYCVNMSRNIEQIPCRLERKKHKIGKKVLSLHFGIRKITPLGVGDFYGFQLTGNHRFLDEDFFVLRNTGKTLCVYLNAVAHLLGIHHNSLGKPPVKIKCLVPSFDSVEDVALEKLLENQRILLPRDKEGKAIISNKHQKWVDFLEQHKALVDANLTGGWIEVGPIMPHSMIVPKKSYTKEHRGIELKNGSSIWWVTSEQGWMAQRGSEQDIVLIDEEGDERVTDECVRGLRNAKGGGKVIAGMTPPYEPGAGPTWTKEKIVEASLKDPDIHVINACMADNPAIDAEFIDRFSRGKTQKQIDIQIYGKYPTWGDMVHPDFQDRVFDPKKLDGHLLTNDTELPENWEVDWVMAFDWHPSKPCAAVFGYIDADGNLTIFDELDKDVADGKDIGELANIFKSIEGHPHHRRQFRRWQDPSAQHDYNAVKRGFNAWDAFRKEGIVTAAGKNRDPEVGISITNEYFKGNLKDHPRLFIYERCKHLRNALSNHYWKRSPDGKGKPDPKWSDYPICVRYIAQEMGWNIKNKKREGRLPLVSYEKAEVNKRTFRLDRLVA